MLAKPLLVAVAFKFAPSQGNTRYLFFMIPIVARHNMPPLCYFMTSPPMEIHIHVYLPQTAKTALLLLLTTNVNRE